MEVHRAVDSEAGDRYPLVPLLITSFRYIVMTKEYTYFVQSESGGPIKIGYTRQDPSQRLANLQTGSPTILKIVGLIEGNVESSLHVKFASDRIHGEWFNPSQKILDFIKNECKIQASSRELQIGERKVVKPNSVSRMSLSGSSKLTDIIEFDFIYDLNKFSEMELVDEQLRMSGLFYDAPYEVDNTESLESPEEARSFEEEYEDRTEHSECEMDAIEKLVGCIYSVNEEVHFGRTSQFFTHICINNDRGLFVILSNPCSSKRRFDGLNAVASWTDDVDAFTGHWSFLSIFEDNYKLVGIDLFKLHARSKNYFFDPYSLVPTFNVADNHIGQ